MSLTGHRVDYINFILDIGNGKVEELISYNQLFEHLEIAQDNDADVAYADMPNHEQTN